MEKKLILKSDILSALENLGVKPGQVIMVHTSLGSIGYVCGGAQTMIEALTEAVGSEGTIMMPTQSWKNLDPETGVHWDVGKDCWQAIRDNLSNIFGDGSPVGKLYELDAYVLLIGVGYDKNTSLHLADARAEYKSKHLCTEHSAVMENGKRVWKAYNTLYVDGEDFEQIGAAFEEKHDVKKAVLGDAALRLMKQRELVDFAVRWIEKNRK